MLIGLLVREQYNSGDQDQDGTEDEEEIPRLIRVDLVVEDLSFLVS